MRKRPASNLRLLPYMTANVKFEVDERKDVLWVPNSALRWRPQFKQIAPDARADFVNKKQKQDDSALATNARAPGAARERGDRAHVWVEDNGFVRPVTV